MHTEFWSKNMKERNHLDDQAYTEDKSITRTSKNRTWRCELDSYGSG